jgi:hypothetical protein
MSRVTSCINDSGTNLPLLPLVLLIPAANLPPVSTSPVEVEKGVACCYCVHVTSSLVLLVDRQREDDSLMYQVWG